MIFNLLSLQYIPQEQAKEVLLKYNFKSVGHRIHTEKLIHTGLFKFWIKEHNNGFILCYDPLKDCIFNDYILLKAIRLVVSISDLR